MSLFQSKHYLVLASLVLLIIVAASSCRDGDEPAHEVDEAAGSVDRSAVRSDVVTDSGLFRGSLDRSGFFNTQSPRNGVLQKRIELSVHEAPNTMLIADGRLYVDKYGLRAYDLETGRIIWAYETGSTGRAALADGVLYFGTNTGRLIALDTTDGGEIWSAAAARTAITNAPVVLDDMILLGGDGGFRAFDRADGRGLWAPHRAVIDYDVSDYFAVRGHQVFCSVLKPEGRSTNEQASEFLVLDVDRDGGRLITSLAGGEQGTRELWFSPPALWGERAYVTQGRAIHALNIETGAEVWRHELDRKTQEWGPCIVEGKLITITGGGDASEYSVVAFDTAEREVLWTHRLDGIPSSAPVATNDMVVIGHRDRGLLALELATGNRLWQFDSDQQVSGEILIDDGVAYFSTSDGYVYGVE